MSKLRTLLISTFIFLFNHNYAQLVPYNPSEWDTEWTYTVFQDSFDGTTLDPSKWKVITNFGRGECVFVDLPGTTYSISNGSLRLNMLNNTGNNYCFTKYPEGTTICPDFISSEVSSKNSYKYGIYEGRMKFASSTGSWPAFWMHGGSEPDAPEYDGFGTEIDFAEYNWSYGGNDVNTDHVFHYWLDEPGEQMSISDGLHHTGVTWSTWHTFKIIYRPYDVTFYIDGNFSWRRSRFYCIWNTGDGTILSDIFIEDIYEQPHPIYYEWDWFPKHGGVITLSQQVPYYNHIDGSVVVPQTSYFDYVTFKKFFAKPEITCPNIICSTTNATLDVDDAATNITWTLSSNFGVFSGNLSGAGKTATIIPSSTNHGTGKITWTFNMPSGESFTAEKEIRVNGPGYEDVSLDIYKSTGEHATNVSGTWLLCPNTHYHIYLMNDFGACSLSNYSWSLPSAWSVNYTYNNMISIYTNSLAGGMIEVSATTCCGINTKVLTDYVGQNYNCGGYYSMAISPNPATSETTVSLESNSEEVIFDEDIEWELAVYDQAQLEKEKKIKIKGKEVKIQTSGWKKGIYYVRVRYKDEILTGKLSVEE